MKLFYIISLVLIGTLTSCSQQKYQKPTEALAVVNDRSITLDDFQKQIMPMTAFKGIDTQSISGKKKVLDDMVFQELIFQKAIKEGLHLKNLEIKHAVVDQYLKNKYKNTLEKINEEAIRKYYEQHKDNLDKVHARHIVILAKKDDAEERKLALNKIREIAQEIKSGKIDFADAAKKYSQDSSAANGGDLGYFTRLTMVDNFAKAAFSLQTPLEISSIVDTEFGYHLIQLLDHQVGLEFHQRRIRSHLITQQIQEESNLYYLTLKDGNHVEIFYDRLPQDENK